MANLLRKLARWLGSVPVRYVDAGLVLAVTLGGLVLFAFTGIGENKRAGFVFVQQIEERTLDLRFALRGERQHDEQIVIVGIDDKTLQNTGSYPFPRKSYAQLVDVLHAGGAKIVGFDVTFPTAESNSATAALLSLRNRLGSSASPETRRTIAELEVSSDQDAAFAAAMKRSGNVLLGHFFLDRDRVKGVNPARAEEYFNIVWGKAIPQMIPVGNAGTPFDLGQAWTANGGSVASGTEANIAPLASAAASYGYLDIASDADGTLRHALLVLGYYHDKDFYLFPSLALEMLREYHKLPDQQVAAYIAPNGLERLEMGATSLHPSRDGTTLINFVGPYQTYTHYSMWDVLQGTVPADAFRDKIVLVGATAIGIGDIRTTPYQGHGRTYMGVEVHANILDNLLHSDEAGRGFLTRGIWEELTDAALILLFGLAFGALFCLLRPLLATATVLLTLAAFCGFVYWAFAIQGRWLSLVIPATTLIVNYAAVTSYRMVFEEREKRRVRKTFGQYLSPDVIALIEKDPERYIRMGGESRELTVMFSDIRGFTTISETLEPCAVVQLLNEYLSQMTDAVFQEQGTLDKYIGDAVMAFWGSPYPQQDHAARACRSALEMMRRLEQLNARWKSLGKPQFDIGVGIHTGTMNVGNMGSDRRLSWTVIGDNVNLASRLEGVNKEYRCHILITEATWTLVHEQFAARLLDRIRVKGREREAVAIYELLGDASQSPAFAPRIRAYGEAMAAYAAEDWRLAAERFAALLRDFPEDGPAQVMHDRCMQFHLIPPTNWTGIYDLHHK